MKNLIFAILFLLTASGIYAQIPPVATAEAKDHVGETILVKGKVADVYTSQKGTILINFDEKYPNQTFTVVINESSNIDISKITAGVTLTVSGFIKSYKDKPEIIIETQDQIVNIE